MMFLFKKEKIILTAYYDNPELMEMFPVVEANKKWPAYYQTLGKDFKRPDAKDSKWPDNITEKQSTIRACYGINNFNNYGFILPLWSDYSTIIHEGNAFVKGADQNTAHFHDAHQYTGSLDPFHVFKLESPWEFVCNKDIKFMMTQNIFAVNSEHFCITPGITDFYHQTTTNIFLMVNKNQSDKEILLKAGVPLVKYIALTEQDVELRYEQVEDVKKVKIKPFKYFFLNGLPRMMRAKKLARETEKKCPFHWK
jgi:hypothetical protein